MGRQIRMRAVQVRAPTTPQDSACGHGATWGQSLPLRPTGQIWRGRGQATSFTCSGFSEEIPPLALTCWWDPAPDLQRCPQLRSGGRPRFAAGTESGTVRVEPRFPPAASFNRAPPRLCLTPHRRAAGEERGHKTRLPRRAPPFLRARGAGRVPFCGAGRWKAFPVWLGEQGGSS
ncbi:hypothetical protein NN561_011293 [Cricetulus griseus]